MRIIEPQAGSYAFNLEECEERWLISAYEEIKDSIPADQTWPAAFESHYYQVGHAVRERFVAQINRERKRCSLEELTLKETWVGDYPRTNDKTYKAGRRRGWRDEYCHLPVQQRMEWFIRNRDETLALPPPHMVYADWKVKRESFDGNLPSATEMAMRSKTSETTAPAVEPNVRIYRQLTLCKSLPNADNLIAAIVAKVDPDTALDVAEQIDDPALISVLVQRSLER